MYSKIRLSCVFFTIAIYHVTCGSIVNIKEENLTETGWEAQDMPDPRYAPEKCGISESGWICDPDGVFRNASVGGGPTAADALNMELWNTANKSHCPCPDKKCYVHNAIILVAVVEKLKNPGGLSRSRLLNRFARELQEQHWKADDTDCQQEIIVVISLKDQAIVTEIGDDILKSGMLTYEDVKLIGGVSQALHASHNLVGHIRFIISTYERYLDHPAPAQPSTPKQDIDQVHPSTPKQDINHVHTSMPTITNSSSGDQQGLAFTKSPRIGQESKSGVYRASTGDGLPSSIIVVIVLSVLVFVALVALILTIPFCKKGDKFCFGNN